MLRIAYPSVLDLAAESAPVTHTLEISNGLARLGHQVRVWAPARPPEMDFAYSRLWCFWRLPRWHRLRQWLLWREAALRFLASHTRRRFDCIYARYEAGAGPIIRAARLAGVPLFLEINGTTRQIGTWGHLSAEDWQRLNATWTRDLHLATALLTTGPGIVKSLGDLHGIAKERMFVIENGVDASTFRPLDRMECRRQRGIPPARLILGYVGSYQIYHDLKTPLQSVAQLRQQGCDSWLYCLGKGRLREGYAQLAQELGVADFVRWLDPVPKSEVASFINCIDYALNTIHGALAEEIRSFKLLEYLACGCPVISTRLESGADPMARYVLEVPPDDPKALTELLLRVRDDPAPRAQALKASQVVAQDYSWERAARQTAAALASFVRELNFPRRPGPVV
ncbi:MAG: hypothetical protein AMXMBFR33_46040 [Candidatus Xenobia bacterium]